MRTLLLIMMMTTLWTLLLIQLFANNFTFFYPFPASYFLDDIYKPAHLDSMKNYGTHRHLCFSACVTSFEVCYWSFWKRSNNSNFNPSIIINNNCHILVTTSIINNIIISIMLERVFFVLFIIITIIIIFLIFKEYFKILSAIIREIDIKNNYYYAV